MPGRLSLAAWLGLAALTAAACTGGSAAPPATTTSPPRTTESARATPPPSAAPQPTLADLERQWAADRAAVVARIKANGWGRSADGTTVTGPGGFSIDLTRCPEGWSDTEGLTDAEITIGHTVTTTGALADLAQLTQAAELVIAHVNEAGGIAEPSGRRRTIKLAVRDDGYDPARTIPLVDELIASRSVFALWTTGSQSGLATYDKANAACVPQPLVVSGLPAFGDPLAHPWTTGHALPLNAEAAAWVAYIEQHVSELTAGDGRVRVAAVVLNSLPGNDSGPAYLNGFLAALRRSTVADLVDVDIHISDPYAEQMNGPQERAMTTPPDIFIAMVVGTTCDVTLNGVYELGFRATRTPAFVASMCASPRNLLATEYLGVAEAGDGWLVIGDGLRDVASPAQRADPFVSWLLAEADDSALRASRHLGPGAAHGWTWTQALQIAAELDGGLTRTNLIVALRALDMTHPMVIDGVRFGMAGNADAFLIEGSELSRFDAAAQAWTPTGTVFDLSGTTPNCTWGGSVRARPYPPGERLADPCAAGAE